jgi:hypothetical protein
VVMINARSSNRSSTVVILCCKVINQGAQRVLRFCISLLSRCMVPSGCSGKISERRRN